MYIQVNFPDPAERAQLCAMLRTWRELSCVSLDIRAAQKSLVPREPAIVFWDLDGPEEPPAAWQNDSLQIYFARENTSKRFDQCDYTVGLTTPGIPFAYLNHAPEGRFIGEANATEGIDTAVRVTVKKTASNTLQYDLFFPAEVLPGIAMKAGNSLRFSLLINDNDRNGRKTGLTLNPPGTEPYRNSRRFPELVLIR